MSYFWQNPLPPARADRWTRFGTRGASFQADDDVIYVIQPAAVGGNYFRARVVYTGALPKSARSKTAWLTPAGNESLKKMSALDDEEEYLTFRDAREGVLRARKHYAELHRTPAEPRRKPKRVSKQKRLKRLGVVKRGER